MEATRTKRQKVAVACDNCRSRKICEPCQKRVGGDALCTWDTSSSRVGLENSTEWMRSHDSRTSQLDQNNIQAYQPNDSRIMGTAFEWSIPQSTPVNRTNDLNVAQSSISRSTSSVPRYEGIQPMVSAPTGMPIEDRPRQEASWSTDNILPLGYQYDHAIMGRNIEQSRRRALFGGFRGGTFMDEVKKIVKQKLHGTPQTHSSPSAQKRDSLPLLFPHRECRQHEIDYTLPPRKQADSLMDAYWRYLHVLHPYLDKAQTQDDYEKIWMGDDSVTDERSFLCLLNIILAISCRLIGLTTSKERDRSAATFYLRARELMDVVEMASVRSVQTFLFLAEYFQSTSQPHQCWVFVGLAIHTAQNLGLHLPQTSESTSNMHTRELLRKVWYGCVLMDRVVALKYGQPSTISAKTASAVPFPLAIDEGNLLQGSVLRHAVEATSIIDFYISSLKLYEIFQDITFILDSAKLRSQTVDGSHNMHASHLSGHLPSIEGHSFVYEVEQRLSHWEKGLPGHLKIGNYAQSEGTDSVLHRQAIVLHQRHLYTHLLLLRPVLSSFVISDLKNAGKPVPFGSLLTHRTSLQCAIVCVKISQEAIDIIYRDDVAGKVESLAAWWDNVLYVYTSAMILIAARISSSVLADVPEESLFDGLRKAVEILDRYKLFSASIPRLSATLRLLVEVVPRQYSRVYQQSREEDAGTTGGNQTPSISGATFSFWCPLKPNVSPSHPSYQTSRHSDFANDQPALTEVRPEFDAVFDPEDFTWLMTIPPDN